MGWFSKSDDSFFLSTVTPDGQAAKVERYLGVVNGEALRLTWKQRFFM